MRPGRSVGALAPARGLGAFADGAAVAAVNGDHADAAGRLNGGRRHGHLTSTSQNFFSSLLLTLFESKLKLFSLQAFIAMSNICGWHLKTPLG